MEEITVLKLILVGVPETILNLLIGLVLCRDNVKKDWRSFILKICISVIVSLIMIFFVRRIFYTFTLIGATMTLVYIFIFKLVWGMNFRQSILSGCSVIFFLICLETISLPLYNTLLKNFNINNFFEASLPFTPFLRLVHTLVFIIFTKWNLRGNQLISGEWRKQNKYSRIAIIVIIISIIWCMVAMVNYIDFNYKIVTNQENISFLIGNIKVVFWMTIWFFIFLLVLIYYIFNFLNAQKMLDISIEEIIKIISDELSKEDILKYINYLQEKYKEKGGI